MRIRTRTKKRTIARFLAGKKIAIVGGGPAGLTLARLLQTRGADAVVFERDAASAARTSGGCLDLHRKTGQAALGAAGVLAEFRRLSRPEGDQWTILDKRGVVRLDFPAIQILGVRPEIERADLRALLLDSLRPGTVRWGAQCVGMEGGGPRLLRFADGSVATADLVVACDGANSKLRRHATAQAPTYSGATVLQGEVSDPASRCPQALSWANGGTFFATGDGKNVMGQVKGEHALSVLVTLQAPWSWSDECGVDWGDADCVRDWADEFLPGWNPALRDLVVQAVPLVPRRMLGSSADQTWKTLPDFTLLGDAAHVMPPFAGQGANMAMRDALDLADELSDTRHADLPAALAAYERRMLARTAKAQRDTREAEERFHAQDGIDRQLRAFLGPFAPFSAHVPKVIRALNRLTRPVLPWF